MPPLYLRKGSFFVQKTGSTTDPLSGQKIRKLTYNGIELGSRVGYEAQWVQVSKKLSDAYTVFVSATTVVNNTNQPLTIKFGGAFYDGAALPFLRESRGSELPHFEKPFTQFDCFRKGRFKEGLSVTSADQSFVLQPGTSIDFTALTARLWSEFIFSKREFRYFVKVDNKDFVFSWARPLYDYDLCGVEFLAR